jgi:hypothetical protein
MVLYIIEVFNFLENTIQRDFIYYKNGFKPLKRKIKFTRNLQLFNDELTKKLKENRKVVFPSMLCNPTQKYKNIYTDLNYRVICHNGIEKNNDILKYFKNEWPNCDLLIYSPTIEAGVDYDKENFNCCMGYMSINSTSAKAFCQMLHRVRNFKDEEVLIYIGDLSYSENTILHFPDCLEQDLIENYDTKKGLGNIQKYNKCKALNTKHFLLNDFVNIIERKGYE